MTENRSASFPDVREGFAKTIATVIDMERKHNVNPETDRCVMCGRNRWNRERFPVCDYDPVTTASKIPFEQAQGRILATLPKLGTVCSWVSGITGQLKTGMFWKLANGDSGIGDPYVTLHTDHGARTLRLSAITWENNGKDK